MSWCKRLRGLKLVVDVSDAENDCGSLWIYWRGLHPPEWDLRLFGSVDGTGTYRTYVELRGADAEYPLRWRICLWRLDLRWYCSRKCEKCLCYQHPTWPCPNRHRCACGTPERT